MNAKVLGKITQEFRQQYGYTKEEYKAYSIGLAIGQIEKILLGVCDSAMFRPSANHFNWLFDELTSISKKLGLNISIVELGDIYETNKEIWIHKDKNTVYNFSLYNMNSPRWHTARGLAVGIPLNLIDINYHLRDGYNKNCD